MRLRRLWTSVALGQLVLATAGCSKVVPVEGRILLDGQPLGGAMVVFYPEEAADLQQKDGPRQAETMTNQDGFFRLQTVNRTGALPGNYKVTVWRQGFRLSENYTHRDKTSLRVEVPKNGRKDVEIALTSQLASGR